MKTFRLLYITLIAALLAACGGGGRGDDRPDRKPTSDAAIPAPTSLPAPAPNEYRTPNTYAIKVFDNYIVSDAKRNRKFSILIRYPVGAPNPLPLIVFSHGGGPNNNGHRLYNEWGETFARAGYGVIHMAHAESNYDAHCTPLKIPASECEASDFKKEVSAGGTLSAAVYDRPRDASAVLDDLDNIERAANLKFDRARTGIAGHSGGTVAVMSNAGAILDVSPSIHNLSSVDSRFKAFLANSPQGIGYLGMTATSWDKISVPVMIATGAADTSDGEQAKDRLDPFKFMPPGDKYQLYVDSKQATHGTFGLNPDGTLELEPYVAVNGIAFFDAYLRGLPEAKAWLNSDNMKLWSKGVATITTK
ncbi:MAG: hypothetical protein HZB17_10130 [Chloroflexi bacterium]|nr:hypothetical protein [Chloroflexota bacterium]